MKRKYDGASCSQCRAGGRSIDDADPIDGKRESGRESVELPANNAHRGALLDLPPADRGPGSRPVEH
jgi:hypothetical protein